MTGSTESAGGVGGKRPGWAVLRYQLFKALWIAAVASNLGTWMHEVGAAWLMTSLSASPLMVSGYSVCPVCTHAPACSGESISLHVLRKLRLGAHAAGCQDLGRGAASYGLLLGFMGAGAVLGGSILPRVQQALSTDRLLGGALVLYAFGLFLLGFSHRLVLSCVATALAGVAWTSLLSTLKAIVQIEASAWVRGRALSVYQLCMFGGTAIGSVIWGLVATPIPAFLPLCLLRR